MTNAVNLETLYTTPVTLRGRHVTLVPLNLEHSGALQRALNDDEEIWRYIPVEQPHTLPEMHAWIATALEEQTQRRRVPFAVLLNADGDVIGRDRKSVV